MRQLILILIVITNFTVAAFAQEQTTLQERIKPEFSNDHESFLTFTLENDLFGAGTDEHYTNGIRITYYDEASNTQTIEENIEKFIPIFDINETTGIYYSVGQNLYTPEVITTQTPNPNDRPYAAFLYGSIGANTITDNHRDELELTLGIVGPLALGKEVQKTVHNLIGADDPSGWDSQLKNEPALIIAGQRVWPEAITKELDSLLFKVAPHIGASLGNVYTYANTGVTFQLTPKQLRWQFPPLRVRPSIPGSGYFSIPDGRFAWSTFFGIEARAVARNIFLDGNSFTDSPSVNKKHFVTDISGGLTFTYGQTQFSYTLNWRSDEFEQQSDNSLFGALSLTRKF